MSSLVAPQGRFDPDHHDSGSPMNEPSVIRLLLVDGDDLFRRSLARSLADREFQVTECNDGRIGLDLLRHDQGFDLIFLDWRMAGTGGLELMREIKGLGIATPVVFLTDQPSERNEAVALDNGAVDFLEKSRSAALLARRVRILVDSRRGSRAEPVEVLRLGPLEIQARRSRAYWGGAPVPLTATEFRVVQLLASRAGEDVSYRAIYDVVHGRGFIAGDGDQGYRTNVRSMIKRIRQKFRELDAGFEAIENYPGVGYLWRPEEPPRLDGAPPPADVLDKLSRLPFVRSVASWRRRQERGQEELLRVRPAGEGEEAGREAAEPPQATARSQPERR